MAMDDPPDGRQPNASALELRLRVQALEGAKEPVGVGHVEASAIVSHGIGTFSARDLQGAKFDAGVWTPAGELPRVFEEVLQHRAKRPRITLSDEAVCNDELRRCCRAVWLIVSADWTLA
jgi:hypothetical protein